MAIRSDVMARRRRKSQSQLDKAAIGIGRVLGKALNRLEKIGVRAKRKKIAKRPRASSRATGSRRRTAARRAPRRRTNR
jgi:hypothetical protein